MGVTVAVPLAPPKQLTLVCPPKVAVSTEPIVKFPADPVTTIGLEDGEEVVVQFAVFRIAARIAATVENVLVPE